MKAIELYKSGCSILEISKKLNTTPHRIRKNLVDNNIEIRSLSDTMKTFYKKNPDKHPWKRNTKFLSKPCENFKNILIDNNISFIEEYSDFIEHSYSIDVALPEYKIGYEINGNQHYNKDGTLKEYYSKREEYITKQGWKLYQLHYSLCYKEELVLDIIKKSIINETIFEFDYDKYLFNKLNKTIKVKPKTKKCSCGELIVNKSKNCLKCYDIKQRIVKRPTYEILKLEIKKYGFVKTGKKYSVSDNSIRKWIKYYEKNL